MKQIKIYILLACSLLVVSSCNEEDFLTEVNPNAVTSATYWQTGGQFDAALNTVYAGLQSRYVSGGQLVYEMAMGDIAGTWSWYRPFPFRNLTITDATKQVQEKWADVYVGIFRANQVIHYLNTNQVEDFAAGEKDLVEAQARFLRAFYYFQLIHTYGGAVINTELISDVSETKKPLSDIATVTQQVIIPDLEFAEQYLPTEWTGEDLGRVTWGAAVSLIGKSYLYVQDWTNAASHFKEVIDSDIYDLVSDVRHNYSDENEFNSESIFEVAFSDALKPGVNGGIVDSYGETAGAESTTIATEIANINYGGFNTIFPTYNLIELFEYDEIDPSNNNNFGLTQSSRMSASILTKDADGVYYGIPSAEVKGFSGGQMGYVKKHTNWYQWEAESNDRNGINFRHIRLADVYLMYAEAILQANGAAATTEALSYIDMVRARAGVITLEQYMADNAGLIPELHISVQVHGPRTYTAPTADALLTHLMKVERPLELCYEGHRWKDLVRWGIVREVFDELRADELWREENWDAITNQAPLYLTGGLKEEYELAHRNYNSSAHDYMPIPTFEVQINDQLGVSN